MLGLLVGLAIGLNIRIYEWPEKIRQEICKPTILVSPTPEITPIIEPTSAPVAPQRQIKGKASYYSVDGCLGCRKDLKMANGEVFKDLAFTLANNELPLNTNVLVENTRNGQKAVAKVTDRGGFGKYDRVADLSLALATSIGLKTDTDIITITIIK